MVIFSFSSFESEEANISKYKVAISPHFSKKLKKNKTTLLCLALKVGAKNVVLIFQFELKHFFKFRKNTDLHSTSLTSVEVWECNCTK